MSDSKVWTKKIVQQHAKVAADVELYTIPFYTTVMTSIKDVNSEAYKIIQGILIEEMMHLQLASNLCVALDTTPQFNSPNFHCDIPYLKPGVVLNADMEPLNENSLRVMLAIETPESVLAGNGDSTPNGNDTPQYPYSSIGEMYNALFTGIEKVGPEQFSWNTDDQHQFWVDQGYPQIISTPEEARQAVDAIEAQGEGGHTEQNINDPNQASNSDNFLITPEEYQMNNTAPDGSFHIPIELKKYCHYGRLLHIKNTGIPETYTGTDNPTYKANKELRVKLAMMLGTLNMLWLGDTFMPPGARWGMALQLMRDVGSLARECWENGVVPDWS
ncbi:MAG: ferritin-like domain-containing protein [Candidatus Electrothrix scaldis]|nr:MAG: ferritin-like domain-containing protein [Candidatus Electrothrix sp. GW3-3]